VCIKCGAIKGEEDWVIKLVSLVAKHCLKLGAVAAMDKRIREHGFHAHQHVFGNVSTYCLSGMVGVHEIPTFSLGINLDLISFL
jgi:hypothetical protein